MKFCDLFDTLCCIGAKSPSNMTLSHLHNTTKKKSRNSATNKLPRNKNMFRIYIENAWKYFGNLSLKGSTVSTFLHEIRQLNIWMIEYTETRIVFNWVRLICTSCLLKQLSKKWNSLHFFSAAGKSRRPLDKYRQSISSMLRKLLKSGHVFEIFLILSLDNIFMS